MHAPLHVKSLDAQGELNANVNFTIHLDDLRELNRLFGGDLQVIDGENLQTGLVDLQEE